MSRLERINNMPNHQADVKFDMITKFLFKLYNRQYQQIESLVGNKKEKEVING